MKKIGLDTNFFMAIFLQIESQSGQFIFTPLMINGQKLSSS